jgi:hypothetical protein
MNEVEDFRQIKILFWITFVVGLITFFCPFIEGEIRWRIYWFVLKMYVFEGKEVTARFGFILILVSGTLIWLPMIGYFFHRYTVQKRYYTIKQRLVNYFLFGIGATIYILPAYALIDSGKGIQELFFLEWGYWLLLICTSILFICYIKVQKRQLIEHDLSAHLITEDEN